MPERILGYAIIPMWFVSASGWAFWVGVHFLMRPWEFLK